MERIPVKSSQLVSFGWEPLKDNPEMGTLEVEFHPNKSQPNGSVYHYANVPKSVFDEFKVAESFGSFLIQRIKKGGFSFTKIEQKPVDDGKLLPELPKEEGNDK